MFLIVICSLKIGISQIYVVLRVHKESTCIYTICTFILSDVEKFPTDQLIFMSIKNLTVDFPFESPLVELFFVVLYTVYIHFFMA